MADKRSEVERQRRRELFDTMAGVITPFDDLALTVTLIDFGMSVVRDELLEQSTDGDAV
ncbi:hypothetical protein I5Q34_20350 [Streptomyces sp. AV19]|uniref:hypothetical protein n=1 Tax=Streptomyces sp. AV19 TaxID=2793068 RepID=UPI0018FF0F84|nr:hypothetical protein [Streptomyces sp. AV19]MBH1936599.1 hypothetical protein [Streptomyces sp. AV19]MDG4532659.1 hypothetical protein [Streptomyces sp. AV19]